MDFDNDNDNLVYPTLVHCQIAVSNALTQSRGGNAPPPPPPPSLSASVLKRIEDSTARQQNLISAMNRINFDVEKQVLARAKEREKLLDAATSKNRDMANHESVEVAWGKGDDEKAKSLCGGCVVLTD